MTEPITDPVARAAASVTQSHLFRLFVVGFLTIALLVPIVMIGGLVGERAGRRSSAVEEVAAKWGSVQTVTGPALTLPYTFRWTETTRDGATVVKAEVRRATLLPDDLRITGTIDTETRRRGIFLVPVYTLRATLTGTFSRAAVADLGLVPADILWDRAELAMGVSDVRAIQEQVAVTWNDRPIQLRPGAGLFAEAGPGIHASVPARPDGPPDTFSLPLVLAGSDAAYFSPFGRDTTVEVTSNSPHPRFDGRWLPIEHAISADGFRARWVVPSLGRNYPQAWTSAAPPAAAIADSRFGVGLASPIDPYRMAERSVKYAALFVLLTFATIWLIEVLGHARVHPIQYLMLGAALCLFYLLELSLSEHLGFTWAYATAATLVIGLVAGYSATLFGQLRPVLVVTLGVTGLYAYLFVLLMNEDAALLAGSLGLFVVLAAVMVVTRRVDWYSLTGPQARHEL